MRNATAIHAERVARSRLAQHRQRASAMRTRSAPPDASCDAKPGGDLHPSSNAAAAALRGTRAQRAGGGAVPAQRARKARRGGEARAGRLRRGHFRHTRPAPSSAAPRLTRGHPTWSMHAVAAARRAQWRRLRVPAAAQALALAWQGAALRAAARCGARRRYRGRMQRCRMARERARRASGDR